MLFIELEYNSIATEKKTLQIHAGGNYMLEILHVKQEKIFLSSTNSNSDCSSNTK